MAITLTVATTEAACSTNQPPGGEGPLSIAAAGNGGVYPPAFEEPGTLGPRLDLRARSSLPLLTALRRGSRITLRTSEAGRLVLRVRLTHRIARRLGYDKRVVGSLAQIVTAGRVCTRQGWTAGPHRAHSDREARLGLHPADPASYRSASASKWRRAGRTARSWSSAEESCETDVIGRAPGGSGETSSETRSR